MSAVAKARWRAKANDYSDAKRQGLLEKGLAMIYGNGGQGDAEGSPPGQRHPDKLAGELVPILVNFGFHFFFHFAKSVFHLLVAFPINSAL